MSIERMRKEVEVVKSLTAQLPGEHVTPYYGKSEIDHWLAHILDMLAADIEMESWFWYPATAKAKSVVILGDGSVLNATDWLKQRAAEQAKHDEPSHKALPFDPEQ